MSVYILSVLDIPLTSFHSSFPHQTSEQEQAPGPTRVAIPEHTKAHQTVSSIHVYSLPCISPGFGLIDTVFVAVMVLVPCGASEQSLPSHSFYQSWVA